MLIKDIILIKNNYYYIITLLNENNCLLDIIEGSTYVGGYLIQKLFVHALIRLDAIDLFKT